MSHELRTPLNAIIGYSEMLQEEAEELGQEDFTPDLQKIHAAGQHLLALINDILDLSKIEAGKMDLFLETFDIFTMIQEVVTTIQLLVDPATVPPLRPSHSQPVKIFVRRYSHVRRFKQQVRKFLACLQAYSAWPLLGKAGGTIMKRRLIML